MGGQDIAFVDTGGPCLDLKIENGDYVADDGLENAVLISLFTDRFVPAAELPPGIEDNAGWWADRIDPESTDRIGSRIWVFNRIGKINPETRNGLVDATKEALQWMIDAGIAERIRVVGTVVTGERIDLPIKIFRPRDEDRSFNFLWDGQELRRRG